MIKDLVAGATSSNPYGFFNLNGTVFFYTGSGTNPIYLWKSDGSAAGTVQVKPLVPMGNPSVYPTKFIDFNGTLFFSIKETCPKVF